MVALKRAPEATFPQLPNLVHQVRFQVWKSAPDRNVMVPLATVPDTSYSEHTGVASVLPTTRELARYSQAQARLSIQVRRQLQPLFLS